MGYCRVVATEGKVVFVHQLGQDGKPYAEDVTIVAQEGVPATRVDWVKYDGQVGTISWGFTPTTSDTSSIKFPGA